VRLGLHAAKLNAVIGDVKGHTVEAAKEIGLQTGSIQLYLTCLFLGVVIMAAVYAYVGTVS
jgi:hypothetical protein